MAEVIPLDVAVSKERTRTRVIASDPRLVVVAAAFYQRDHHRIRPGDAIFGAADQHGCAMDSSALGQCKRLNQPRSGFRIVGNGSVAGPVELARAFNLRDSGQIAVRPCGAAISGRSEADIGRASIGKASNLKGGNDGVSDCEARWFNFRFVLAGGVVESVVADLGQWNLGDRGVGCKHECHKREECAAFRYCAIL